MNSRHTPGPWQASTRLPVVVAQMGPFDRLIFVAESVDHRLALEERLANAALIADAPALLAALVEVLPDLRPQAGSPRHRADCDCRFCRLSALVARHGGRVPPVFWQESRKKGGAS